MAAFVHRLTSSLTLADLPDTDGLPNPLPDVSPGMGGRRRGDGEGGRERDVHAFQHHPSTPLRLILFFRLLEEV